MKKLLISLVLIVLFVILFFLVKPATEQDAVLTPSQTPLTLEPNYTDPTYGYKIYIPEGFIADDQSKQSTLFYPQNQPQGAGPTNFIYISVVPPDMRNSVGEIYNYNPSDFAKLIALEKVGDKTSLAGSPDMAEWFTYSVVEEFDFGSGRIKNFENTKPWEFPLGTTENRFIYATENNIYILGYYSGGTSGATIDPREAYKSILSFKVK